MVFLAPDPLLRFPREHLCDLLDILGGCAQNWLMYVSYTDQPVLYLSA